MRSLSPRCWFCFYRKRESSRQDMKQSRRGTFSILNYDEEIKTHFSISLLPSFIRRKFGTFLFIVSRFSFQTFLNKNKQKSSELNSLSCAMRHTTKKEIYKTLE